MSTVTSNGVRISAEVFYQESNSNPAMNKFIFAYRITIENLNEFPIQLTDRHWKIWDSMGGIRIVEGKGVIGEKPIIEVGQSHDYMSWSHISAVIGSMSGFYNMCNMENQETFTATIPKFYLIAPFKFN